MQAVKDEFLASPEKQSTDFIDSNLSLEELPCPRHIGKDIDDTIEGVYILMNNDDVIYVGKGKIKARLKSHYSKVCGSAEYYPDGWAQFLKKEDRNRVEIAERLNRVKDLRCREWEVIYMPIDNEGLRSGVEGCLIMVLNPKANQETFKNHV
jgi:hypothetical protein